MKQPHRKLVRSYNEPGHAHALTFSCFRRLPLLSKDRSRSWFIEAMESARQRRQLALWAYVIMPEHIHLIVCPQQAMYEVRLIRTALKDRYNAKLWASCVATLLLISATCATGSPMARSIIVFGNAAGATTAISPTRQRCGA
jgi:REP element-mobilizing transposase RayT